jgi:hypothetical protein
MILSIEESVKIIKYLSMFPIDSSSHDKQHVFSVTLEEVFFEKKPQVSLVVHLHLCSMMKGRSWNLQEGRGIYIRLHGPQS